MITWGKASEPIPAGAPVVCAGGRVYRAPWGVANATAEHFPAFCWSSEYGPMVYAEGAKVDCEPLPIDVGRMDLKAIAAGPIRDALKLYLPAGKLTEAEYQQRLDLQFARAGLSADDRQANSKRQPERRA